MYSILWLDLCHQSLFVHLDSFQLQYLSNNSFLYNAAVNIFVYTFLPT